MASLTRRQRNLVVRDVLEREGVGTSIWGERDCVTLILELVVAFSDTRPVDPRLPSESIKQFLVRQKQLHSTIRKAWVHNLNQISSLKVFTFSKIQPGMIALTKNKFDCPRGVPVYPGPVVTIIDSGYRAWARMTEGIAEVHPISPSDIWGIKGAHF